MSKDFKTDQSTKKVRFGGTETVKFNSNDAPKKQVRSTSLAQKMLKKIQVI